MAENYLFFAKNGDNDADKDAIMFPQSRFLGASSSAVLGLNLYFEDCELL